jgi:hypothetical protein
MQVFFAYLSMIGSKECNLQHHSSKWLVFWYHFVKKKKLLVGRVFFAGQKLKKSYIKALCVFSATLEYG